MASNVLVLAAAGRIKTICDLRNAAAIYARQTSFPPPSPFLLPSFLIRVICSSSIWLSSALDEMAAAVVGPVRVRPDQFKASLIALTSLASRDRDGGGEGPRQHTDRYRLVGWDQPGRQNFSLDIKDIKLLSCQQYNALG